MIYQPAEDSYLMSEILKEKLPKMLEENSNLKFLEIGAGSGIHLETALKIGVKKENIFSVDINQNAVNHCLSLGFNCVNSDLFQNVSEKFDVIIFNPPYLPEDAREPCDSQTATTGGKKGCEIINRFLKEVGNYLKEVGKIFLITSSLSENVNFLDYSKEKVGCEKLFMEELCVWELEL